MEKTQNRRMDAGRVDARLLALTGLFAALGRPWSCRSPPPPGDT